MQSFYFTVNAERCIAQFAVVKREVVNVSVAVANNLDFGITSASEGDFLGRSRLRLKKLIWLSCE